jgi:hypothetical protein
MKPWLILSAATIAGLHCCVCPAAEEANVLSDAERDAGFELLFNGEKLEGWQHAGNWKVEEGAITRTGRGGSLVYDVRPVPDDFELRFEWKVARGSNSGVYYRPTQYEYQILDNAVHADGKNPRTSAASLYFCMPPSHDATKPVGEWNQGRIVCKGSVIQHWLNGEKVIDFDYTDPEWKFEVELLKQRGGDLTARGAKLSLQDHGDPVWYRGIKLRKLGADDELDRTPVTPAKIPDDILKAEAEKLRGIVERRRREQ